MSQQLLDTSKFSTGFLGAKTFMLPGDRIHKFGVECLGPDINGHFLSDGITFRAGSWRPGGEYIQKLIVRNISTTVKKLKYQLPTTRYFSLSYPEVIVLSPGMFTELDVIFRPVQFEPYDDSIYFKMLDGPGSEGFHVPVKANIDKLIVTVPPGIDLGYCTTHQLKTISFKLSNIGEVDSPFRWNMPKPYVIEPSFGVVKAGEAIDIQVHIVPSDASVIVAKAICTVGEGVHAIIPEPVLVTKLSCIGKFAYIVLSDKEVNFGEVLSGTHPDSIKKDVLLRNNNIVPAEFSVIRHESDKDEVFEVEPRSGIIPPQSEIVISVKYHALASGNFSLDRYTFVTPGACSTTLTLCGLSIAPRITFYKDSSSHSDEGFVDGSPGNSINFRDVELGGRCTKVAFLRNDSTRDVIYSIVTDEQGIFKIDQKCGVIRAQSQHAFKMTFDPKNPINYYNRFFVLISDALPLFFDVMGSGFIRAKGEIKEFRPAPLRHAHVQAFRNRAVHGISRLNPDELDEMFQQLLKGESFNFTNSIANSEFFAQVGMAGTKAMSMTTLQNPLTRTGETTRVAIAPAHEFFIEYTDSECKEITINRTAVDFGYTAYMTSSEPKTLTITNHTRGKVCVQWEIPDMHNDQENSRSEHRQSSDNDDMTVSRRSLESKVIKAGSTYDIDTSNKVFFIEPMIEDILPGQSATFKVTFQPKQSNRNFCSVLEAYIFFKNQRTFRLVNDTTMTPPWCIAVNAVGHTFSTGQLLANVKLMGSVVRNGKLDFPTTYINDYVYQTVIVRNTSNLPAVFQIKLGWSDTTMGGGGGGFSASKMSSPAFSCKPTMGEVRAEDAVLICIRFHPTEAKRYTELMQIFVNGSKSGKLLLEGMGGSPFTILPSLSSVKDDEEHIPGPAIGFDFTDSLNMNSLGGSQSVVEMMTTNIAVKPSLSISGINRPVPDGLIPKGLLGNFFMTPTCVGLSSTRQFTVHNGSRLPARFLITLPSEAAGIISIYPSKGLLKGNECIVVTVTFTPHRPDRYEFKAKLRTYAIGGKPQKVIDARQAGKVESPALLQTSYCFIIAPSEVSALIFDPPRLTLDVKLVNTFEIKDIFIENVSDSALNYKLFYKMEFLPDSAKIDGVEREITDIIPILKDESVSGAAPRNMDHNLFCEFPSGILPARSRLRVPVTFYPLKSGLFEFLVYAQITSVDGNDVSNDEALMLRLAEERRLGITSDGKLDARSTQILSKTIELVPLMTNITARASFPKLLFEDIRVEDESLVANVDYLWRQFSFASINLDLAKPLTESENNLFTSSSPNYTRFNRYEFRFTPNVIGSPIQSLVMRVRNDGYLDTQFHVHFPNEKELELEIWCDEDDPSEEQNMLIAIIEELKCFQIEPKSAHLKPGESCDVTISYKHSSMKYGGYHQLPLLFKIDHGKQFFIDLIGRTLPNPMGHRSATIGGASILSHDHNHKHPGSPGKTPLQPPISSSAGGGGALVAAGGNATGGSHKKIGSDAVYNPFNKPTPTALLWIPADKSGFVSLSAVEIGLDSVSAPRQRIEIFNVSNENILFEVDQASFSDVSADNFGEPIIQLANSRGNIGPQSSKLLEFYFYPLEAKTYEIPVVVKYRKDSRGGSQFTSSNFGGALKPISSKFDDYSVVSKGNSSQHHSHSHHEVNTTDGKVVMETLTFNLRVIGYHPRLPKPLKAEALFRGGVAPVTQIVKPLRQFALLSSDVIDFNLVPQNATIHRMVVLRNLHDHAAIEFTIDESSCLLLPNRTLSVFPMSGRIECKDHIVLDVKFISTCEPCNIAGESFKINIRELIKAQGRNKGGVNNKLMDKLRKRPPTTDHASIVSRNTQARDSRMNETISVGWKGLEGRNAQMPSTFNSKGVSVLASTSADEIAFASSHDGMRSSSTPLEHDRLGTGQTAHTAYSANANNDRAVSPTNSSTSRMRSSGTVITAASGMSKSGMGHREQHLLGASNVLIVRLDGTVMPPQVIETLIPDNGDSNSNLNSNNKIKSSILQSSKILKEVVLPTSPEFVFPVKHTGGSSYDHDVGLGLVGTEPPIPPPGTGGGGSTMSNGGGKRAVMNGPIHSIRQPEIRSISDFLLQDLFQSILGEATTKELLVKTCASSSGEPSSLTTVAGGFGSANTNPKSRLSFSDLNDLRKPIAGDPVAGVYFHEIADPLPLYKRFFHEVVHLGFPVSLGTSSSSQSSSSSSSPSSSSSEEKKDSENTNNNNEADVVSKYLDVNEAALVFIGAESFTMTKDKFKEALVAIGLSSKGKVFKQIVKSLEQKSGKLIGLSSGPSIQDDREPSLEQQTVRVASLMKNLSVEAIDLIEKKILLLQTHRITQEKLSRMTQNDAKVRALSMESMESKDGSLQPPPGDSLDVEAEAEVEAEVIDPDDWRASLREANKAAMKIQSIGRGKAARKITNNLFTEQDSKRASLLLLESEMLEFVGEVSRNVMYNLVQEASYGEFAYSATPLKFMLKK